MGSVEIEQVYRQIVEFAENMVPGKSYCLAQGQGALTEQEATLI